MRNVLLGPVIVGALLALYACSEDVGPAHPHDLSAWNEYTHAEARLRARPIVIEHDQGGTIADHVKWYERFKVSGTSIKIDGICISACTLVHMLPPGQVCITLRSSLGYHTAYDRQGPLPEQTEAIFNLTLPQVVRSYIREAVKLREQELTPRDVLYIQADQLIAWGVFREC